MERGVGLGCVEISEMSEMSEMNEMNGSSGEQRVAEQQTRFQFSVGIDILRVALDGECDKMNKMIGKAATGGQCNDHNALGSGAAGSGVP